jgi:uncharacterized glyoxalase superfamily protein PhnB
MSKRPARQPGTPWLSPYLTVRDADAALDFYQRAFGFEKRCAFPGPDGRTAGIIPAAGCKFVHGDLASPVSGGPSAY